MNKFNFGRKYVKYQPIKDGIGDNATGFTIMGFYEMPSLEDYFNRLIPEVRSMSYYTDNNKPQGFRGHNGKQKELKTIKKFHHKGRYPKPR
jgi:hypothetical protein